LGEKLISKFRVSCYRILTKLSFNFKVKRKNWVFEFLVRVRAPPHFFHFVLIYHRLLTIINITLMVRIHLPLP
jgi:hypothetical protein